MRWLPRLRHGKTGDAQPSLDPPARDLPAGDREPPAPAGDRDLPTGDTAQHAADRVAGPAHWRRLPLLTPTVRRAPLTVAPAMGVFADEQNRPLIHPPGRRVAAVDRFADRSGSPVPAAGTDEGRPAEPAAGRVTGLIAVRAEAPPEPEAPVQPAPPTPAPVRRRAVAVEPAQGPEPESVSAPEPAAARLAPRVLPSAGRRPNLVTADDEHVGPPEPDSAPQAASAWLRMVESYRPPWANDPSAAALGAALSLPPIPEGGASWSSEAPPPRAPKPARPDVPAVPERRASLAESRRLGLGKPLRPRPSQEPDSSGPSARSTETAGESPGDTPAEPAVPAVPAAPDEARESRLEHPRTPAAAAPSAPDTAAAPVAGDDAATDEGRSPRPAPETPVRPDRPDQGAPAPQPPLRLGLAAPIERPVRRSRDTSSGVRPTPAQTPRPRTPPAQTPPAQTPPPLTPPPPAQAGPQPRSQTVGETAGQAAFPTEDVVTPPRPAPARRAEPVYRYAPGGRPTQTTATVAQPTPPAPAAIPAPASAPARTASPSAPLSMPARAPMPAPVPIAPSPTPVVPASPASPAPPAVSPLTHPRAPRRTDGFEPQQPAAFPPAEQRREQVQVSPAELLDAVRRMQGVDVSDVPVHRGPEVADAARSLGARSFTRDGEVFLPMEQGSPDQAAARGLLAHELTHAAQQRTFGSALPAEDSDAGRALEAQAVAAERWARGLGAEPAPSGGAGFSSGASWTAPWHASAPTGGVQRQTGDVTGAAESEFPAAPAAEPAAPSAAPAEPPESGPAPAHDAELGEARDKLVALSKQRPLDLDDPSDIEELSVRVYQKIERRLRRELLVDRERAGRLGETGPFGPSR
jgi:hypothetical protein